MLDLVRLDPKIHDRKGFDCGVPALNTYLQTQAGKSDKRFITNTYVLVDTDNPHQIIGFITLTYGECVAPDSGPLKNYPHPVPAIKLCRMAIANDFKGLRLGEQLLNDAIVRTAAIADTNSIAPVVGLFVDAKEGAVDFYLRYGFIQVCAGNESLLYLPIQNCIDAATV